MEQRVWIPRREPAVLPELPVIAAVLIVSGSSHGCFRVQRGIGMKGKEGRWNPAMLANWLINI